MHRSTYTGVYKNGGPTSVDEVINLASLVDRDRSSGGGAPGSAARDRLSSGGGRCGAAFFFDGKSVCVQWLAGGRAGGRASWKLAVAYDCFHAPFPHVAPTGAPPRRWAAQ